MQGIGIRLTAMSPDSRNSPPCLAFRPFNPVSSLLANGSLRLRTRREIRLLRLHMIDIRISMNDFDCFDHCVRETRPGNSARVPVHGRRLHSIGY
ncbi:hypothetical protein [Burkholderia plantarii]|uniref:hypothetical protein n=1 Tax=Burkholderia plantarii TaxID=41899 RepID=UPI000F4FAFB5|nr:hypothetical protein [Burkholderia plantarii]